MSDLIRRSEAIEAVCESCDLEGDYHKCDGYPKDSTWCEEITALRKVPSAQPKTGEWILTDFPDEQTYKCSSCNEHWTFLEGTPYDNGAYFCPNCGADMRGEKNE